MRTRIAVTIALAVLCLLPNAVKGEDFSPLFPFLISYDGPQNASSMAHLLDAPAGRHGFIRNENGHFVNDVGPVRLHATNLTGPANFPSHAAADKLAARLARFGINCVRLHYMDAAYGNFMTRNVQGIIAEDPATRRKLDPGQVDRLDYLIAAFKKHGIYVDLNLHVAREWDTRDGFPAPSTGLCKGLDIFEPRMIDLQKEYARQLLTHVNPYTGRPYTDEPSVAVVEINNENALMRNYFGGAIDNLPAPYAAEFRQQWNNWLRRKYASTDDLRKAWKVADTPLSDEQIPEGKFTRPVAFDGRNWILSLDTARAAATVAGGVLRIDVTRGGNEYFPKMFRALSVKKDHPYTLSFRIRRTAGPGKTATLGVAVADARKGWRSLGVHQTIKVGADWKTCTCSFLAGDDSDKAQFQLTRFTPGTYELADLSFQSGSKSDFTAMQRIEDGSIPALKSSGFAPRPAVRDFYQFLYDTETRYWLGMYRFLKDELKLKSPVSGTQICGYSPAFIQAQLDYCDNHSYWCHPGPVNSQWRIRNESMVNSMACIQGLAGVRVLGKPYTVSEYNHPFPNEYGAEGQPMLRAYAALQGWDGVFEYTYNHQPDFEPDHNTYFFSMVARTDVLAHFPACAAIFLRGDVREAKSSVVGSLDFTGYFDRLVASQTLPATIAAAGVDPRQSLLHKTAVDLTGKAAAQPARVEEIPDARKVFVSDTGELTWNVERPGAGIFTINTPNTKLFTGFPDGRTIDLGGVSLQVGKTRLNWATVSLVSRQATGFGESGKAADILLAATGLSQNKGMLVDRISDKSISLHDKWGTGPVLAEGIPATVSLPAAAERVKCFALDPHGDRRQPVPVESSGRGSKIVLKPEYKTVWYEIAIQ